MSRPRKPPWKTLRSSASLRLTHQPKFKQQLVEDALEKIPIGTSGERLVDLVDAPGGPGVERRVGVAECPFISGKLAVWMHEALLQEEQELRLGEFGVDDREGHGLEAQIP